MFFSLTLMLWWYSCVILIVVDVGHCCYIQSIKGGVVTGKFVRTPEKGMFTNFSLFHQAPMYKLYIVKHVK
jgi:hypothetical protein